MVILGAPGSGKTVLLLELLVQLLEQRARTRLTGAEAAVPVRLSLAAWDTRQPFDTWLAAQLAQQSGLEPALAQRLVDDRMVLPLLDGLDEMDRDDVAPMRAAAAVSRLNAWLHGRQLAPLGPGAK